MDCKLTVIDYSVSELGESPVWDHRNNCFYWLDVLKGKVFSYQEGHKPQLRIQLPYSIGALALCDDLNILLLATERGLAFYDLQQSKFKKICDPEQGLNENRFNDAKCDPQGRFWAGTMAKNGRGTEGHLYCLKGDQRINTKLSNINCSNGLAWSEDKMYYIDTGQGGIDEFDYDPLSGNISNRRRLFSLKVEEGLLDGMSMDQDGLLWVALWGAGAVIAVDPAKAEEVDRIFLPVSQITSCTFGGKDLSTLFITTASIGIKQKEEPLAGHVFTYQMPNKGQQTHFYKLAR